MTAADARAWVVESQNGDSTVPVRAGERLSEYQLLEALMLPSGDNIADILATWDAGSMQFFVAKMNTQARALDLTRTSYADPSGVSAGSKSTPAEQITVASQLMENAVARQIVSQKSVALPVAGTIYNVNPALGVDGILGVKSGFTHLAMGCLAIAAMRTVGHKQVMVITISTGSTFGLYGAARVDEQLLTETRQNLVTVSPIKTGTLLGNIDLAGSTTLLPLHTLGSAPTFVAWKGAHLTSKVLVIPTAAPGEAGLVARLVYSTPTGTLGSVKLTGAPMLMNAANGTTS
jgi:D-alanyl-D-alanine carboxypeptidase (penicillin-binding protein 5/6)